MNTAQVQMSMAQLKKSSRCTVTVSNYANLNHLMVTM